MATESGLTKKKKKLTIFTILGALSLAKQEMPVTDLYKKFRKEVQILIADLPNSIIVQSVQSHSWDVKNTYG